MKMYKAYKFRMYPNDNQKSLIHKSFGTSRFIYNKLLEYKDKMYKENNISISLKDMMLMLPQLKEEYPFIKEVDSCLCQNTIKNLNNAFDRFFKGYGYPKYKKKGIKDSFKTNNITNTYKNEVYNSIKLDLKNKIITLPKIGDVKVKGYRKLDKISLK